VQAQVGSHCLECARASRPPATVRVRDWNAAQPTLVTYVLMTINIGVFGLFALADPATLSGRITQLHADYGLNRSIVHDTDEWYRLVTAGFIHFGLIHIAMNMLLLFQLGQMLERAMTRVEYTLLYLAGLLAGSAGVVLLDGDRLTITGGASGAVFGLMAAAAIGLHRRGVNVFTTGIGMTLILNLVLTFSISGVSIGGHLGGAIGGAICGWVMLAPHWKPPPKVASIATPVAVITLALLVSYVVIEYGAVAGG